MFSIQVVGLEPTRLAATDFESVVSAIPPHLRNDIKKKNRKTDLKNWRRQSDLNRRSGCCRPMPYHLAMPPLFGAEDEVRTRDPHLGKVVFYH